jgi:hypothetical protein
MEVEDKSIDSSEVFIDSYYNIVILTVIYRDTIMMTHAPYAPHKLYGTAALTHHTSSPRSLPLPLPLFHQAGSGIPLFRCLDKFTESERIEDVVCPSCKVRCYAIRRVKNNKCWDRT